MTARCSIAYLVVIGLWATRRVARALAFALEQRADGSAAAGRVVEATLLPVYCATVLLGIAIVVADVAESRQGTFVEEWYGLLSSIGDGMLGLIASAIAMLCIWRRRERARWVAVTVAQAFGAAGVAAGFFLSLPALRPADDHDTWYFWHASPPVLWLVFLAIVTLLGVLAIVRVWQSIQDEPRFPWATLIYLVVLVAYLAGFGKLTGFWVSSWIYGAFFVTRLSTYAFFLCEPKTPPVLRSGWFACYVAALLLCIASTTHQMTTGNFAMMMQPLLMMPIAPVQTMSSPWAFSLSLFLALTRDILFLLWLNRIRPSGWADAIGVVALALLYEPIAIWLAILGWGFLFPVIYPLTVEGPVDLLWPLAMIGLLIALLVRSRRAFSETNSLA